MRPELGVGSRCRACLCRGRFWPGWPRRSGFESPRSPQVHRRSVVAAPMLPTAEPGHRSTVLREPVSEANGPGRAIDGPCPCLAFVASARQGQGLTRKAAGHGRRLQGSRRIRSDDPDVLGFLALAAWTHVELDGLALVEGLVPVPLDVGVVNEDVVAALSCNEAEALLGVEELDGTCSQN